MNTKKRKRMAVIGMLGGLCFGIGDLLVYLLPNYHNKNGMYLDWIEMSGLRPTFSTYLACIGAGLLMIGFFSWYGAVKEEASKILNVFMMLIAFSIILTPIGHYFIACMEPMVFKGAIEAGVSTEVALKIIESWGTYLNLVWTVVMLLSILVQSVTMVVLIVKGKINCPKWMVVLNPVGLTLLSIPISMLLSGTGLEGAMDSFESLGEGFIYFPVLFHWKRTEL